MRLKITELNFVNKCNWLFKLIDDNGKQYYLMNNAFYKANHLKTPITKKELDFYDEGVWISARVENIAGIDIVMSLLTE